MGLNQQHKVLFQGHRGAFGGQILRELLSDSLMNTFILWEDLKVVKKKKSQAGLLNKQEVSTMDTSKILSPFEDPSPSLTHIHPPHLE